MPDFDLLVGWEARLGGVDDALHCPKGHELQPADSDQTGQLIARPTSVTKTCSASRSLGLCGMRGVMLEQARDWQQH